MTQDQNFTNKASSRKTTSLADRVTESDGPSLAQAFPMPVIGKIALLAALLVVINYRQFAMLWQGWHDPNWSHGFIIPLFSIFLLYVRRNELAAARRSLCMWGLPIMILGLLGQVVSVFPGRNNWLCQLNMIVVMLGLVLYLGGWQVFRLAWLPIAFLALAMPIPGLLYSRMAYPLQELVAKSSYGILQLFGVQIENTASNLTITSLTGQIGNITIVEACSGVQSLMAYLALAIAWAYIEERPIWQRIIFVLSAIPIAVLCNILRITITCEMYVIDKPQLGQKFMHEFTGMLMLIPALGLLWLVSRLLQSLFIEVDEEEAAEPGAER